MGEGRGPRGRGDAFGLVRLCAEDALALVLAGQVRASVLVEETELEGRDAREGVPTQKGE